MSNARPPRHPITWATHSMHLMMVLAVLVGGTLFGLAFAVWPQSTFDLWLGRAILAGVAALAGWALWFLSRPVARG